MVGSAFEVGSRTRKGGKTDNRNDDRTYRARRRKDASDNGQWQCQSGKRGEAIICGPFPRKPTNQIPAKAGKLYVIFRQIITNFVPRDILLRHIWPVMGNWVCLPVPGGVYHLPKYISKNDLPMHLKWIYSRFID